MFLVEFLYGRYPEYPTPNGATPQWKRNDERHEFNQRRSRRLRRKARQFGPKTGISEQAHSRDRRQGCGGRSDALGLHAKRFAGR